MTVNKNLYVSEKHWALLELNYRRLGNEKDSLFSEKRKLFELVW